MHQTKNPAPRGKSENGENCQAAKPDTGNPATIRRALQATPAACRVTVDQHQPSRRAIAPPPDLDDDGPDLDFIDNPRERRREREINRLFDILDSLPPAREETERMTRE